MTTAIEILIAFLIVLGSLFALVGSWGLARLPTLMSRLHGPTKATTLGVGGCLLASMFYFPLETGIWSAHELLITLFLFITAPVAANMIAKAHLHRQRCNLDAESMDSIRESLPAPEPGGDWATFRLDRAGEKP
jgi:multicomponent K+:H+ antiporter subunit G